MEKNNKLKFLLLFLGAIIFLFSYANNTTSFFTLMILSYSFNVTIIILIAVLIMNTLDIIKDFNENYLLLCRTKNLNDYYTKQVKACLKSNFTIITIYLILIISASIIGCLGNFTIPNNPYYSFNFIIILLYYTIKFFSIMLLLSIFPIFFSNTLRKIGNILYFGILTMLAMIATTKEDFIILGITNYPLNYIEVLSFLKYGTFLHDILAFLFYISILTILIYLFKNWVLKHRKDIN